MTTPAPAHANAALGGRRTPEEWGWLSAVLDHSPAVVYVKDRDGRHLYVNHRFEELFGVALDRVTGRTSHELFPADVADRLTAHDQQVLDGGTPCESEEVVPNPDGPRALASLKFPLRDPAGRVTGLCAISTDVTDRRLAEEQLRREKEFTEGLIASSVDGILAFDVDCRYTVWNPGMERITGVPAARVLGRPACEAFPFLAETGEDRAFREALAGRPAITRDRPYVIPESGRAGFYEGHYAPVHDAAGRVVGGLAVIRDVTDRKRLEEERVGSAKEQAARAAAEAAARRFEFLAEAGEALAASLDYDQTLNDVARLCVPALGDLCIVDVVEDGRLRRVATAHANPTKAELLEDLRRRYPPPPDSPQPAARVLRTGEPELLPEVTPEVVAAHTRDADHAALIRAIGIRSHLAVPLVARGHPVGVISLGITESGRRYGPDDLALARELSRRAALAVDNARLYRAAQVELAERRRADEARRESEARFRAAVGQAAVGVALVAPDGRTLFVNPGLCALLGYTEPELLARSFADVTHPDDLAADFEHVRRLLAREVASCRYEKRYVRKDGAVVRADLSVGAVSDDAGEVRYVVGVVVDVTDRRRAEERLRLSEERFRAVMEQSPLATQIFSPDGTLARVNRAWERLWGVTMDQIPEYNVLSDPQLEALGIAPFVRRAFAGEAVEIPAVRYDPNATIPDRTRHADPVRWVRAFAYPVRDGEGAVREVVLVQEDTTARVLAEEGLRASEGRLRLATAGARMVVWDWDLATDRVACSENAAEFWGIEVGRAADFVAVIHPDDRDAVRAAARTATAGGPYLAEYRITGAGGPVRWVQSRGRVDYGPDGAAARILGVTVDITDLKAAEAATRLLADAGETLGSSLDYHATLASLARVVVPRLADWCAVDLLTDAGDLERVAVAHPDPQRVAAATELFGRYPPRRDAARGAWRVLATGEPEWAEDITDDMLRAAARDAEHLRLLRELGLRSYVCVPLVARGERVGVLTLVHAESGRRYRPADVDLAKDLARRAAAAVDNARLYQRLRGEDRRKDEFLATLAHELRNPLAPIRTGLQVLRLAEAGEVAERTRAMMDRQLAHMVRLVDDLLDLSRVTRGKVSLRKERVDLAAVVGTAVETCRPHIDAAGHELVVRLPDESVVLEADRTRLAQVLGNLLHNAAKYTERGGRVELSARREAGEVVVHVTDTGVGIPKEMLSQVFEMFSQVGRSLDRSQGGLGIGLTLVKRLVELHGGRAWAESDGPGRGSTFVVRLPAAPESGLLTAAPAPRGGRPTSASARRVLVVDDNADAADSLAMLLELHGHTVRVAGSGPAALDLVAEFRPDVAFLDIGLPGMTGYELASRLRQDPALRGVLLVAVTGWGQEEDRRLSREAGFDHHLTKPADPAAVQALLAGE